MNKYSTAVQTAQFDSETGYCNVAGWLTIYNTDLDTHEYTGATYEYVPIGIAPPPNVYTNAPELPPEGKALRRTADGNAWEHVDDHRGTVAYDTETRQQITVTEIGDIPATLTLLEPATSYDKWNGKKWVTDKAAQQQAVIDAATAQKSSLLAEADNFIHPLQEALDLEMAEEGDSEKLTVWRKYRVLLNRVDVTAAKITWPPKPEA